MADLDNNIFSNLAKPTDLSKYTLFRGVTDFANLAQYSLFETGYSFLIVVGVPKFLETLANKSTDYKNLLNSYIHVLEYEFRGLDGIEDMQIDPSDLTNGINTIQLITKVNKQAGSNFSMRFFEKHGSTITRLHQLFLEGVKDPRTQVKTYHGLIQNGTMEAGFENETFSFMYMVTDNTLMNVEKAFYIVAAQPTKSELSIYNVQKGEIEFKEVGVEFNGFPISGKTVDAKAKSLLEWIRKNTVWNESEAIYTGVDTMKPVSDIVTSTGLTSVALK